MLNFFKGKKEVSIAAPMTGEVIEIAKVPDEVFAEKMVGDGLAIIPSEGTVVAPCNGEIMQVFPTNHAIGLLTKEGVEILIHVGLDTVNLKGNGFKAYVTQGDKVKRGDKLLEFDIDYISQNAKSTISPIVITNMQIVDKFSINKGAVEKGKDKIMNITLK